MLLPAIALALGNVLCTKLLSVPLAIALLILLFALAIHYATYELSLSLSLTSRSLSAALLFDRIVNP